MAWFQKLCRKTGLLVHEITKPVQPQNTQRREVSRRVEEKQVDEQVTLRRTTIEEVEVKRTDRGTEPPSDRGSSE